MVFDEIKSLSKKFRYYGMQYISVLLVNPNVSGGPKKTRRTLDANKS